MSTSTARWRVVCEVQGNNPGSDPETEGKLSKSKAKKPPAGKNLGGFVIYLTDGNTRTEISRVAFVRRWSKNPEVTFEEQLKFELDKAQLSAATLNDQAAEAGELQ